MSTPTALPANKGRMHPIGAIDADAPIPTYHNPDHTLKADLLWEITPASPGGGYTYYAGLYTQITNPTGQIKFSVVQERSAITPRTDAGHEGEFTYSILHTTHLGAVGPTEYVLVVTRANGNGIGAGINHKVVGSSTFFLTQA